MKWGFAEAYLLAVTILPALLYLPGTQRLRVPIRVAPFALSVVALVLWFGKARRRHPAYLWLGLAITYCFLMILHPSTNSTLAGLAQTTLYLAIAAPVFWAPALVSSPQRLHRLLTILLVCNGMNAAVGILQVYDPDRWLPKEFSRVSENTTGILTYEDDSGKTVVRPPGLSDTPGAVSGPATAAAILGMAYVTAPRIGLVLRVGSAVIATAGVAAIYLCHVRSGFIVFVGSMTVYFLLLLVSRERQRALVILGSGVAILCLAMAVAVMLGGTAVFDRIQTLAMGDPISVYYKSGRGLMLQEAFSKLLVQYPLGAGLGRWGMMRVYFGNPYNRWSPMIWAEVQYPAWILDGGLILLGAYGMAIAVTIRREWQIARRSHDSQLRSLATVIIAINIGVIALTFSYVPFAAPIGAQYWFLTGALHGAATMGGLRQAERSLDFSSATSGFGAPPSRAGRVAQESGFRA